MKYLALILLLLLSGCADLGYYWHSAKGQLSIMHRARAIDDVLQDPHTTPALKRQLRKVQVFRRFAVTQLALPKSGSYTEYADLERPYVLKNLFASDEFSIQLQRWCYPLVGCAGYRGYFDEQMLADFTAQLAHQHKDVYVANVSAYSTLGWFDDPVLNTFINWPDYRLAGLIFHELAHQRLYIDGDTRFNESFAVAVQQAGVEKWLQAQGDTIRLQRYRQLLRNRARVVGLIEQMRQRLGRLYRSDMSAALKRVRKQQLLQQLRQQYQQMSDTFDVKDGFARWFQSDLNNAKLASVSTYHAEVGAFRRLLHEQGGDFDAFYRRVEALGALPKAQRQQQLALRADHLTFE